MIVGAVGVADRAAIAHQFIQIGPQRLGHHHEGRHRQQSRGDVRHQRAELHIAGQHHVTGADAALRRDDTLAHAGRVDRQRRRVLENARARLFGQLRQAERVIERMNVEGSGEMHGVEIALVGKLRPHLGRRPHFGVGAEPAQALDPGARRLRAVGLVDMQPAIGPGDAGQFVVVDSVADVVQSLLRQRPELLGMIEADALDHGIDAFRITRQHETGIAAGGGRGHARALQYHHRPAAPRDLARHGQAGKAGADDADVDVEVEGEALARRACHPRRLVPGRRCGRVLRHRHPLLAS